MKNTGRSAKWFFLVVEATSAAVEVPIGNHYDKYAAKNPIARKLMAGFMTALDAALPNTKPATVFELGMGEGEVTERVRARYGPAGSG